MNKEELRKINKEKRRELLKDDINEKSVKATKIFLESNIYKTANTIMLYYPLGNEMDTSYIFKSAIDDGKTVAFPITDIKTNELTAIVADSDTQFSKGEYKIFEPESDNAIDKDKIDVVIVPGIAFDKNGNRIGFGKGCYDRFLKDTNAIKIGFGYEFQMTNEILADSFDVCMDYLICENGLVNCE